MFRKALAILAMVLFSALFFVACPDPGSSPKYGEGDADSIMTESQDTAPPIDAAGNLGPCTIDGDCDDDNQCTTDTCQDGVCDNHPTEDGWKVPCDDGNPCTKNDHCEADQCVSEPKTTEEVLLEKYDFLRPINAVDFIIHSDDDHLLDGISWSECWGTPEVKTDKWGGTKTCDLPFTTGAPCQDVMIIGDGEGLFTTNPEWWVVWSEVFSGTCYWDPYDYFNSAVPGCVATAPVCSVVFDEQEAYGCRVNDVFGYQSYHSWLFLSDIEECFDPIKEKFVNCADAVEPNPFETPGEKPGDCQAVNKHEGAPCKKMQYNGWNDGVCDGQGECVLSGFNLSDAGACEDSNDCGSGDACQLVSCGFDGVCYAQKNPCDDFDPETTDTCVATNWHAFPDPYNTEYYGFDCYHE